MWKWLMFSSVYNTTEEGASGAEAMRTDEEAPWRTNGIDIITMFEKMKCKQRRLQE